MPFMNSVPDFPCFFTSMQCTMESNRPLFPPGRNAEQDGYQIPETPAMPPDPELIIGHIDRHPSHTP
jgi:hypothetical protein